jgi:hypothetical protein
MMTGASPKGRRSAPPKLAPGVDGNGPKRFSVQRKLAIVARLERDSIHPSLQRISRLNNNYGLYEVIPGIYLVRGFDLSDITFVCGKTGWIVFDPLVSAEPVRAAWALFQKHVGQGLPVSCSSSRLHQRVAVQPFWYVGLAVRPPERPLVL